MRKSLMLAVAVAVLAVLIPASPASALLIDNFNTENGGSGALNYAGFANWDVTGGGTVDLIGVGTAFDFYPGHGLYVDLDGTSGNAGTLSLKSSVGPFTAGNYVLTFLLGGSTRGDTNTVDVVVGGASQSFTLGSGDPLALRTIPFNLAANGPLNLTFHNLGGDNIGLILDDVSVDAVPEPATLVLLGSGLTALALRRRRRQ